MITLLDGGMGQELIARSGDAPTPLWATQVMIDHPGLVQAIHADYFAAGATMATTNTYALHHDRLVGTPAAASFAALHAQALAEARAARDAAGQSGRIDRPPGRVLPRRCRAGTRQGDPALCRDSRDHRPAG
jgi:homocysteine S-methyltransferase